MWHKMGIYQTLKGRLAVREGGEHEQKEEDGQDTASDPEDQDTDDVGWLTEEGDDGWPSGQQQGGRRTHIR